MIADTLGELSKLAEKEKVYLLLENEGSQNIATAPGTRRRHEADSLQMGGLQLGSAQRLRQGEGLPRRLRRCCPKRAC